MEWTQVVRTQLLDPFVEQTAQISYMILINGRPIPGRRTTAPASKRSMVAEAETPWSST